MSGILPAVRPSTEPATPGAVGPILAVLDGRGSDEQVLDLVGLLQTCQDVPALALWAVDVPRRLPLGHTEGIPIDWAVVEQARHAARQVGLPFHMVWGRDRTWSILEETRRENASGLVLAARRGPLSNNALEDGLLYLLAKAPCAVWLVKPGCEGADG